ncbi:Crp/Fnr family transcriptional regulator [Parabacteroides leei]|uniref:Crp/Fnr family transcriptional regulator n=1 Tax=Parabacteroides leei TaxID=2939491 RepID=UPI00189A3C21|nr:Crp/Fnr family transcriptional regulator [Parabacteroides leei]MCL3849773.1 Crp/Fnr family transcriptional regulator [Parabacteroides leei]
MYDYLKQYYPVSDDFCEVLSTLCEQKVFSKKELLVSSGSGCNNLYFISEGFCVCYFEKDGREFVVRFFKEGDVCTPLHSFLGHKKSFFCVRANERTTALCISRKNFDYLWQHFDDFICLIYAVLEKHAVEFEEQFYWMRNLSSVERIRHCIETHEIQILLQRVPQYLVASYLQMTAEHYAKLQSRLNKE